MEGTVSCSSFTLCSSQRLFAGDPVKVEVGLWVIALDSINVLDMVRAITMYNPVTTSKPGLRMRKSWEILNFCNGHLKPFFYIL